MPTTASLLLEIAKKLKGLRYGTATGGSGTTLIDTNMVEPNDYFNGGTIWFLSSKTTPAGTEPTGMTAKISDWNSTTFTFTFPTLASSATAGAGVLYAALDADYPREALIQALNQALVELGPFDAENVALAGIANTYEYDLPAGVSNILKVEIASGTAAPWYEHRHWKEVTGSHLRFDENYGPGAGNTIRLTYGAQHSTMNLDADVVTSDAHVDLIAWTAAKWAALTRSGYAENAEPNTKEMVQYATMMADRMLMRHPMRRTKRTSRWAGLTAPEVY